MKPPRHQTLEIQLLCFNKPKAVENNQTSGVCQISGETVCKTNRHENYKQRTELRETPSIKDDVRCIESESDIRLQNVCGQTHF